MKKGFAILLTIMMLIPALSMLSFAYDPSVTLNVYNWGEYIPDGTDGSMDLNAEFTRRTGIKVNYTTYQSNEEMFTKISNGGVSYDIIIPSDYMISKMIAHDMLAELDFSNIPNFQYIDDQFLNPEYDPENKYSVPYTWGTVGIIYNTTLVDEEDDVYSWDILWNTKYSNQILMFGNSRDAFALSFARLGYSLNTTNETEWHEAAADLMKQKPLVQAYAMDQIMDKMIAGEAALAPYYAGDALTMLEENEDLDFAIPTDQVTNQFVDALCILKDSKHKTEAELYIDFMCDPEIAFEVCDYIGYSTPNRASFELLDDEVKEDGISYPSDEILANTEFFINLPAEIDELQKELWTQVRAESTGSVWSIALVIAAFAAVWAAVAFYKRVWVKRKLKM